MNVTFVLTRFGSGGVEKMVAEAARNLSDLGNNVCLVTGEPESGFLELLGPDARVLPVQLPVAPETLAECLTQTDAHVAISGKLPDDRLLADAADHLDTAPAIVFRVGNPIGHRLRSRTRNPLKRQWLLMSWRRLYARADAYIAVSRGIADDLTHHLRVPSERVYVLPNPTVTTRLFTLANQESGHPWLDDPELPVVLGIGNFRQQKDFPTLIRAFARARQRVSSRLVLLGEGRQRQRLASLAVELGVDRDVDFPGWVSNPYAFLQRSAAFVLSSRWEGSPNALVEATALGVPVIATDCISGPREILDHGRYGTLVPVGDDRAMGKALAAVLINPPDRSTTEKAAQPYQAVNSGKAYAAALEQVIKAQRQG